MRITAELSLYPLHDEPIPTILSFLEHLEAAEGIELIINQMSTQLRGELRDVIRCVQHALEQSFESGRPQVLVAKFLNADLPIGQSPEIGIDD
jgi:uncharacterized protein YqgV (UPF0045/DUF77 family)